MYMPWRALTAISTKTAKPTPTINFSYPKCQEAKPVDVDCTYLIYALISDDMDSSDAVIVNEWIEDVRLRTQSGLYIIDGHECRIKWEKRVLHVRGRSLGIECDPTMLGCVDGDMLHADIFLGTSEQGQIGTSSTIQSPIDTAKQSTRHLDIFTGKTPAATVTFFSKVYDMQKVEEYIQSLGIPRAFHMYHSTLTKTYPNFNVWLTKNDLFRTNILEVWHINRIEMPFTCTEALPRGVPVRSMDNGTSSCYCQCPVGYTIQIISRKLQCVAFDTSDDSCAFNHRSYSYDITERDHDANNQCEIRQFLPTPPLGHVPYPLSNQSNDTLFVQLVRGREILTSKHLQWKLPHENNLLDGLKLKRPGVYSVRVGWDRNDTSCDACIAVTDRHRPTSRHSCPLASLKSLYTTSFGDRKIPTSEYSIQNVLAMDRHIEQHFTYANDVINDACSDNRCDVRQYSRREFFSEYTERLDFANGQKCFDEELSPSLVQRLKIPPFGENAELVALVHPVETGQCLRCCHLEVELKEWWVEYTCPATTPPPQAKCSGNGATCQTSQCLVAFGSTIFGANLVLHDDIVTESQSIMTTLYPSTAYDSSKEIHVLLECTEFDHSHQGRCAYEATWKSMVNLTSYVKDRSIVPVSENIGDEFISWRYRVAGGDGFLWQDAATDNRLMLFDQPNTTVHFEAWSQCGVVATFQVQIILHLQAPICISNVFDQFWYQTTEVDRGSSLLMLYPGSNFAELTFDYDSRMGLACNSQMETNAPPMWVIRNVSCIVRMGNQTPTSLLYVETVHQTVIQRFAIVNGHECSMDVFCTFTYDHTLKRNRNQNIVTASKRFSIQKRDEMVKFIDNEMETEASAIHEICSGNIIRSGVNATKVLRIVRSCPTDATCQSLFSLPNKDQDIGRCQWNVDGMEFVGFARSSVAVLTWCSITIVCVLVIGLVYRNPRSHLLEDDEYMLFEDV